VRRRTHGNANVYGQTIVRRTFDGRDIEVKRIITGREYQNALKTRDPKRHIVKQKRICFLCNQQSFTIHVYRKPVRNLNILHCQSTSDNEVEMPEFLLGLISRQLNLDDPESRDEENYGAYAISLKQRTTSSFLDLSKKNKLHGREAATPAKFR